MVRQYAYFQVTGCGSPDPVTEAVGVQPSDCHSDSEINARTGQPWGVMTWRLDSGELHDAPVQQHVDSLLLWLNRRPTAVKSLADDYDLTLHIACWANDIFGLHLTRDQTRLLGRLGIAIDYDGLVTTADNPNPDEP
ncbi:DUF4279 domain-containing protein [Rhodopirellula baltica]|uniref:DUF4279 domain-containing protein n=1 Tax=Rhodopirellula baltica TaxID=265606 RepID=UPI00055E2C91